MQLMTNPQELDENGNPIPKPLAPEFANLKPPPVVYPEPVAPAPVPAPEPMPVEPVAAPTPAAPAPAPKPFDIVSTTNTSTTAPVANPAEAGTQLALDRDVTDLKALVAKEGEVAREVALTKEAKAIADDAVAVETQARKEQYAAAIQEANNTADAEIDAQYKAQKDFKFKDYWESQSTGNKVLAAIAIGLGGLGAGMQGKDGNGALDIINNAITRDSERQKAEYAQLGDNLKASRDNKTNKLAGLENVEASFAVADAGKYDAALKKMEAGLAKQGVPVAEIATNKIIVGLTQKRNEELLKAQQSLRATRTTAVQQNIVQRTSADNSKAFKDSDDLRKEYANRQETKTTNALRETYGKLKATQDNAAGDLSLVFAYMKMLDPGSAVREGEFANAQNAAGVPQRVLNMYNNAKDGTRLAPGQRADFKNQAGAILSKQVSLQKGVDTEYTRMAKERGYNPKDIIIAGTVEEGGGGQLAPEDQAALAWAKANPRSPLAAQILKENGQ